MTTLVEEALSWNPETESIERKPISEWPKDSMLDVLVRKYGEDMAHAMDFIRETIWKIDGFTPTPMQSEVIFDGQVFKQVVGGVRAGKSKFTSRSCDWYTAIPDGLIWIVGPDYYQCRAEFDYMYAPYQAAGWVSDASIPQEGPRSFQINGGARIETKSSDDLRRLASFAPDAIMVVEAGQQQYGIVEKIMERGLENDAYTVFSGTFEGSLDWYPDLYRMMERPGNVVGGRSYSLPSWSNTIVFPEGKEDPRFKRLAAVFSDDLYMERIEAVPHRPSGVVFKTFDPDVHVQEVEYDSNYPVELAVDPAYHTFAVLFLQQHSSGQVRVLDEVYMHNAIAQDVIKACMDRPLWKHVRSIVADNAARQRHGNISVRQVFQEMTSLPFYTNYVTIQQGIDILELKLKVKDDGQPGVVFSNKLNYGKSGGKANGIRAEFDMYHWPDRNPSKSRRRLPVDENNDAIKALSYWLFHKFGPVDRRRGPKAPRVRQYWNTTRTY